VRLGLRDRLRRGPEVSFSGFLLLAQPLEAALDEGCALAQLQFLLFSCQRRSLSLDRQNFVFRQFTNLKKSGYYPPCWAGTVFISALVEGRKTMNKERNRGEWKLLWLPTEKPSLPGFTTDLIRGSISSITAGTSFCGRFADVPGLHASDGRRPETDQAISKPALMSVEGDCLDMVAQVSSAVVLPHQLIPGRMACLPPLPAKAGTVRVIHGANDDIFNLVGVSVASVQLSLVHAFNIPADAAALVNGVQVFRHYQLRANDTVEFVLQKGRKGVGDHVWTDQEFCQFFKITTEDLQAWITQGLKVKRCLDGSIRITETTVDEFFRGLGNESPYLTVEDAAAYCRTTVKGICSMLETGKLKKCPGSRKCLFTKEMLEAAFMGEEQ
jgi:hypothetical protein